MKNFYLIFIIGASFIANIKICQAEEVKLTSKNFQKEFLQQVSATMKSTATEYLNNFLREIKKPQNIEVNFEPELKSALESTRLEPKVVFIKQYLDLLEHYNPSRENMYGLRNVNFLKKLKHKIHQLQEESFEEMHELRYIYLCKQFRLKKQSNIPAYHNYYSQGIQLMALDVDSKLNKLNLKDNHTISINISEFGQKLYRKVNNAGADVINDYLLIIRKLLQEVLEPQSEEEATPHSETLRKILTEINVLLKIPDFYSKRQRLYDYMQNDLALDYEQIQSSEANQHDLTEVFNKLKEKGLDWVVTFLFSNFEFIDYLQDQWNLLLPEAPISLFDERSRPLKRIQQLYAEFKMDFENSTKYEAYLEAVKLLHEQTQQDNTDSTHIFEILYSASQNVGNSRGTLMNSKCNQI